jgi:glutathione peroxidase
MIAKTATSLHDFTATTASGAEKPLSDYAGQVVLVVNTASKCGLTPQFEGLQQLYSEYAEQGLVVLGFPCNQFRNQEPGTAAEAEEFCSLNYGVSFPMFAKVDVNGAGADPLFTWLRSQKGGLLGSAIKWNFTKFLVGRDGTVLDRYSPTTTPDQLAEDIRAALAA